MDKEDALIVFEEHIRQAEKEHADVKEVEVYYVLVNEHIKDILRFTGLLSYNLKKYIISKILHNLVAVVLGYSFIKLFSSNNVSDAFSYSKYRSFSKEKVSQALSFAL
uniref:Ferroxidase n=1 Tax=Heterorhabditis bacteriophora TaxID=37862 RepID=A0A1I7XLQ6_HETBA